MNWTWSEISCIVVPTIVFSLWIRAILDMRWAYYTLPDDYHLSSYGLLTEYQVVHKRKNLRYNERSGVVQVKMKPLHTALGIPRWRSIGNYMHSYDLEFWKFKRTWLPVKK